MSVPARTASTTEPRALQGPFALPRQPQGDEMPQPDISRVKYGPGSNLRECDGNLGWGEERRRH